MSILEYNKQERNSPSTEEDLYLTLAPRGLESFVIENITSQLTSNRFTCWISEIGPSPFTQLHNARNDRTKDPSDEIAARIEYYKYKKRIKKRKKDSKNKTPEPVVQAMTYDEFLSNSPDLSRVTGSMDVPDIGSHASLGYHTVHDKVQRKLCVPGTLEGVVLVSFKTNAPPLFVASMSGMGCGPLLALVTSSCLQMPLTDEHESVSNDPKLVEGNIFHYEQTMAQSCSAIESFVNKDKDAYFKHFQSALDLWHRHTTEVWHASNSIYGHYKAYDNDAKTLDQQAPIRYRVSCTRTHSKKYSSTEREALVSHVAELVLPTDNLHRIKLRSVSNHATINNSKSTIRMDPTRWVVNLKDYDVEIVGMIHYGCLSIAIPLRPYQLWGSRSYRSNGIPVDGSGSFGRLGPKRCLGRYIHLRPSTADTLIRIADLPPHSIVVDPCAGIGTINIRASLQAHYGIGGEIVPSLFQEHAPYFLDCNRIFQNSQRRGVVDMNGWDATMLPLRDSFVDAIVSDIPFGQKCLTHNELHAFMSGFVYECARVLVKNTGKMVLLCGDYDIVISVLSSLNERSAWKCTSENVVFCLPCQSVFPVNISGILAWIIVVSRGSGKAFPSTNYRVQTKPKSRLSYAR